MGGVKRTHAQIETDKESQLPVHLNSRKKEKPLYCAGSSSTAEKRDAERIYFEGTVLQTC